MKLFRTIRPRLLLIAATIPAVLAFGGNCLAAKVEILQGRLLVNGDPFVVKGVNYRPVPIGVDPETTPPYGDYFTRQYAPIYQRDLPLLRLMGANTIRLWGWNNTADHTDFLDKAYNEGVLPIYVIITFRLDPGLYPDISSSDAREKIKADFRAMVAGYKEHPTVLMWSIGDRLNDAAMYGNKLPDLLTLMNEMALEAHAEEGANPHPVITPLADVELIRTISTHEPVTSAIDAWGLDASRGTSFGALFAEYGAVSKKPLLIMAFGIDAFDMNAHDEYENIGAPFQAIYAESLWNEILANTDIALGGLIRAYSDEWWLGKQGNSFPGCPKIDPPAHSLCGGVSASDPDRFANFEWDGIMRPRKNGSDIDRLEPRALYYTLSSLWLPGYPAADSKMTGPPRDATALFQSGEEHWKSKRWDDAISSYKQFVKHFPADPRAAHAHFKLGSLLEEEDYGEAFVNLQKAEESAPKTPTAHKAKMILARLHFLTGDHGKAITHLREVLGQTTDWSTMKYATHLLKRVNHVAHHANDKHAMIPSCGAKALADVLRIKGRTPAGTDIAKLIQKSDLVLSLEDLKSEAKDWGLDAFGVRFPADQLDRGIELPWIAHFKNNHFVTVTATDSASVKLIDPDVGETQLTKVQFQKKWSGYALIFPDASQASATAYNLSAEQMGKVRGGHHLHGMNLGGKEGSPSVSRDRGPGSVGNCNTPGMPELEVNLANLNLLLQDTDMAYRGRGPRVRLTRSYNSDDPQEGLFGRSWTSNYEVYLTENSGGDVDIRRGSGKLDTFTPNGDGTYAPPRWVYDTLRKNPDGTFSLTLKGSRLKETFDPSGTLTTITDRNGNSVMLQRYQDRLTITDAVGRVTTLLYGSNGKVATVTDPAGKVASFYYDSNNNLIKTMDMAGNEVRYTYNDYSYMTSVITSKGSTTINNIYYDTTFGYIVNSITDPLGNTKTYRSNSLIWVTDANGNTTSYYNLTPYGETTQITDALGNQLDRGLDAAGNINSTSDANGNTMTLIYDPRGNVTKITNQLGSAVHVSYDNNDNILQFIDPLGNVYAYTYDTPGNLLTITDPATPTHGLRAFGYNSFGQLTSLVDAKRNVTSFTYDASGNPTSVRTPGGTDSYTYDTIGRVTSHTDSIGHLTAYTYDGINRLTKITYADGSVKTYSYDCCGISTVTDANGTVTLTYDAANRLTRVRDVYGKIMAYGRDPVGNLTSLTYPDGQVVHYEYDRDNRLVKVTDWGTNATVYEYDGASRLTKMIYPNGTMVRYQYDTANGLKSQIALNAHTGNVNALFEYIRDAAGRTIGLSFSQPLNPDVSRVSTDYTYDADNRLLTGGGATFTYDADGNVIARNGPTGGESYTWDFKGMLAQAVIGGNTYEYRYDGLGNRMARAVNSVQTRYVVDPSSRLSRVLEEIDAAGRITAYYVYGLGLISQTTSDGLTYYYHYDGLGNTVAITNASGDTANKYAYDSFGAVVSQEETVHNAFKYVGRYGVMDEGNGSLYMRARYYDSEAGRFITKDPIAPANQTNRYLYAGNNPQNWIDPSGLSLYPGDGPPDPGDTGPPPFNLPDWKTPSLPPDPPLPPFPKIPGPCPPVHIPGIGDFAWGGCAQGPLTAPLPSWLDPRQPGPGECYQQE